MRVLLTGATSGIGKEISYLLAKKGYDQILIARNKEKIDNHVQKLKSKYKSVRCSYHTADLSSNDDLKKVMNQLRSEESEHIDVLINNAGLFQKGGIEDVDFDSLNSLFKTNVIAPVMLTKYMLKYQKEVSKGHIINICSISSKDGNHDTIAYTISKFGMYGFHKCLLNELRGTGIKSTAILPGPTRTGSWKGEKTDTPMLEAIDVAKVVLSAIEMNGNTQVDELIVTPQGVV